ncbi:MAG: GntR family transcriptional regulator [Paracoccaceae bacterium]|jgi:GntR family histidine utilization transcriptional repressor
MDRANVPATEKTTFRDVKQSVLDRIRDKTWAPGTIIPTEIDLAEEFGCARATVNRAMRELADEGILDRKRKAGTRINAAPIRKAKFAIPLVRVEIEVTGATYRYVLVNEKTQTAPDWLRARLNLPNNSRVVHLKCMHYADNSPFQFEDRWINIAAVPQVEQADFSGTGPNEWLLDQIPFTDVEISFSAGAATIELAEFLSIEPGEPTFTAERTTWLSGTPVTFAKMSFGRGYRLTTHI